MGMFDSFYDQAGNEWQTKAYGCVLANYRVGDVLPSLGEGIADYQVEARGDLGEAVATVTGGILRAIPAERDPALPLVSRYGGIEEPGGTQQPPPHEAETGRVTTERGASMRSERAPLFFADDRDYRTSGVGGEAQMFTMRKMRTPREGGDPDISVGLDSCDAPDLGLKLSPQQAKGLRDYLCNIYPDQDT